MVHKLALIRTSMKLFIALSAVCGLVAGSHAGSFTITQGVDDTFDTSNGVEAMSRSVGFDAYLDTIGPPVSDYFDNPSINVLRGVTFDLSGVGGEITSAQLTLRARPQDDNRAEGNDKIYLSGYGASGNRLFNEYTVGFGTDTGANSYFNFDWQIDNDSGLPYKTPTDPALGFLVTLDLGNFDTLQGTGIDILALLNQYGVLDVYIADDTTVDFIQLTYTAVPIPGTFGLLGMGLVGLGLTRRREKK